MNWSGIRASLSLIAHPSSLLPNLVTKDITRLDWAKFKKNGITGVVIDKDNCITRPHADTLVRSLQPSWDELLRTFGPDNVLIVSNSAGTRKDSLLLQAESVSRNLGVPVLIHGDPKPDWSCARSVSTYFLPPTAAPPPSLLRRMLASKRQLGKVVWPGRERNASSSSPIKPPSIRPQHLLVVGDRLTTDVLLAHRLAHLPPAFPHLLSPKISGPVPSESIDVSIANDGKIRTVSVLTTHLHASESLPTTFLRSLEKVALFFLFRRRDVAFSQTSPDGTTPNEIWESCLISPSSSSAVPQSASTSFFPSLNRRSSITTSDADRNISPSALLEPWHTLFSDPNWAWTTKWADMFGCGTMSEKEMDRTPNGAVRFAEMGVEEVERAVEKTRKRVMDKVEEARKLTRSAVDWRRLASAGLGMGGREK